MALSLRQRPHAASSDRIDDDGGVSTSGEWTRRRELQTRAIRWGLFGCVAAGGLAFVMLVTGIGLPSSTPAKIAAQVQRVDVDGQARAEDLAQTLVKVWLSADRDDEELLSRYVRADGIRLPEEPAFVVADVQVASVTSPEDGAAASRPGRSLFTVTVSASVVPSGEAAAPAVRRFYEVPVVVDPESARAAALPAPVAGPATGTDVNLGYRNRVASSHPINAAVQSFLAALAVGEGELSRYVSPGLAVRPITPPPYTAVALVDLVSDVDLGSDPTVAPTDGQRVRVLATVEATVTQSSSTTAQYALTVVGRGGRWEIGGVDAVPILAESGSSRSASPGEGSTTTPTGSVGGATTPSAPMTSSPGPAR